MKENFFNVMKVVRVLAQNSTIDVKRSFTDFLSDRITIASSEESLLKFIEKLAKLLCADFGKISDSAGIKFTTVVGSDNAKSILNWFREFPKIASMVATLPRQEQTKEACDSLIIDYCNEESGQALPQGNFDIPIKIEMLSPLAHGSDQKAGNATLFRRMQILSNTGSVLNLPFYAGNAFRGELRDVLADHFLNSIGIKPSKNNPKIALWFFHSLYAGGALEENSKAAKAIGELMGKNGSVKADGIHQFRDTLPALSLLGCALGNRILCGRVKFSDYRPACYEWGYGEKPVGQLFEWTYLTRREDNEGHEDGENKSMIANTECLRAGTVLHGGVDIDYHISDLEKSALGRGLLEIQNKGYIGAESRRGFGKIKMEIDNIPSPDLYDNFLNENKNNIINYLTQMDIICTQ